MPPRKKQRLPSTTPTSPPPSTTTKPNTTKSPPKPTDPQILLNDPWTPSEESALYTALLHTKPTGLHKHFRMLQLRARLLSTRAIHPASAHTRIPGIWRKLEGLYDLEALDQREDARQLSDYEDMESGQEGGEAGDGEAGEDDVYSVAANRIHNEDFALPEEDFGAEMWSARFPARAQGESPGVLDEVNMMSEAPVAFTPSFSVEPAESRGSVEVGGEREKRGRGRPRGSGRAGKAVGGAARRSKRQVESVADEEEEEDGEEESGEGSEEESSSEAEESEESTPAPKSGRGGRGRGRGGRGGGAGRRRGRKK